MMSISQTLQQMNRLDRLQWARDGVDWPHREASRFVEAAGLTWHVQVIGEGKQTLLMLHGTGASTHSWASLMQQLTTQQASLKIVALDLPGHAFTDLPLTRQFSTQLSLPGMASGVAALMKMMNLAPDIIIGHSAGAAIAMRMCIDKLVNPQAIMSLNGAIMPLHGLAGQVFSPAAKLLAATPLVPQLFALQASRPAVVKKLLDSTGSTTDEKSAEIYARLVRNPGHATGALGMMAHWDLPSLVRDLPLLNTPLHLITGERDRTIAPAHAARVHQLVKGSSLISLPDVGHLMHEEAPELITQHVMRVLPIKKDM